MLPILWLSRQVILGPSDLNAGRQETPGWNQPVEDRLAVDKTFIAMISYKHVGYDHL